MNFVSVVLLALAMSADAFAVAVVKGTALRRPRWPDALRAGAIFGVIEGITPLIGWALGYAASGFVQSWDHWIAFSLLSILGIRMVAAALRAPVPAETEKPVRHGFWLLAIAGFATSIDAMAVGAGLAFLEVKILPIAAAIGLATFAMVTLGVMVGRFVGLLAGRWAEALGGLILIGMGSAILYEHLHAL